MALLNIAVLRWVARARTDAALAMRADRGKLTATTYNTLQLIETVKATGAEPDSFARWAGFLAKVVTARQRQGVPTAIVTVVPPLLATANSGLILLVGGLRVTDGALSLGLLVAFQSLLGLAQPAGDSADQPGRAAAGHHRGPHQAARRGALPDGPAFLRDLRADRLPAGRHVRDGRR